MMLLKTIRTDRPLVVRGKLSVDLDAASDRLLVLNRNTTEALCATKLSGNKMLDVLLPVQYGNSRDIIVLMLDDSDVYAAVAEDRLQLELVQTSWAD